MNFAYKGVCFLTQLLMLKMLLPERVSSIFKDGFNINSKSQFTKVKNGLLPESMSTVVTSSLLMVTSDVKYEFQNVSGWRLPKKILAKTVSEKAGVVTNAVSEINFTDCTVKK